MRFDHTDLRLFLAVAEAGSITHGAAAAGLSLAAASERLREMEGVSGVSLLERNRRGVRPSEAGLALLHHARLILQQMELLRGEIGQFAKGIRSKIRLMANTAAMTEFLPARLAPWLTAHPQVDVELKERQSADIARSIALGFADIGVLSDSVETAGLVLRPFASDRLVVVAARGHALASARQIRLADLAGEPFIALASGALQEHLGMQAARIGLHLRTRIGLRSFADICLMAGRGAGIGIVPESTARRHRQRDRIATIRLAENWAMRRLSLCTKAGGDLTPLAQDLLNHLENKANA